MTTYRVLACGERALLVELGDLDEVLALDAKVRTHVFDSDLQIEDVVPAAQTLLVATRSPKTLAAVRHLVERLVTTLSVPASSDTAATAAPIIDIGVHYDGPDLEEVARLVGLSSAEVIAAHTGTPWRVGFGGFAPGFAYLVDGDPRLDVPRRDIPRTSVPAGAVGLAGSFSGIYPRSSPGGWQILGHTTESLWDINRTPPALLQPGATVRFFDAGPAIRIERPGATTEDDLAEVDELDPERSVTVLAIGALTLIEDSGRSGWKHVGVGRAGAADRASAAMANRLVGNEPEAALFEVVMGGLKLRLNAPSVVATTGALAPLTVNGKVAAHGQRLYLSPGDELALGTPLAGLRTYVAISGGLTVPPILGSRSADTLAKIGTGEVTVGACLPLGPAPPLPEVRGDHPIVTPSSAELTLEVIPGPRADWFGGTEQLLASSWHVSAQCDRIGVRLEGLPLSRARGFEGVELPSEGVMRGSIQVPPSGQPVVFGSDHPVTGGYPVIGVLTETASDRLAQARPGQVVRFVLKRRTP